MSAERDNGFPSPEMIAHFREEHQSNFSIYFGYAQETLGWKISAESISFAVLSGVLEARGSCETCQFFYEEWFSEFRELDERGRENFCREKEAMNWKRNCVSLSFGAGRSRRTKSNAV